jgi:hypothetical protein
MRDINFLKANEELTWFDHVDTREKATHFSHSLFVSGDYVGGMVQKSNRLAILENEELCQRLGIVELNESYSTDSLLFPIDSLNDSELIEIFEGLEDYCSLDDENVSELEIELESECFDCFGRDDFRRELEKLFPDLEQVIEDLTDEQISEVYYESARNINYEIFTVESGTSGHFDFDCFGGLYDNRVELFKTELNKVIAKG